MNDKSIFVIALKNLKRHLRRTVLNVIGIAVSVGIMFLFIGYYRGTYIVVMRESFLKYKTGHIQMHAKKFNDKKVQDYVTPDTVVSNYTPMIKEISARTDVTGISGRLMNLGYFGNGQEKMVVMITGCDPQYDKNVSVVDEFIKEGNYLDKSDGVLIGKKTAELFGLKLGDMCYLQSQTVHNTPNIITLPVVGIYNTGYYELDKNTVYISLKNANLLFDTSNAINKIVIFLKNMNLSQKVVPQLADKYGKIMNVKPWEYYAEGLLQNEKGDGIFYIIFMMILVFISVSTIMGTMYISVYERIREIGTLRAIGWQQNEIFKLFIYESLCIGLIGSLVGLVVGGIPTWYLAVYGIEYSKMSELISIPIMKLIARTEFYDFIVSILLGMSSTYLGGLLPAQKASKMIITDALRTN